MPKPKSFNRSEIIDKAMKLFWNKGFHATTVEDLVTNLGINRSSIYDSFGSKNDFFHQLIENYQEKRLSQLRQVLFFHDRILNGFVSLFELVIDEALVGSESKGCLLVNSISELASDDFALKKKMEDYVSQIEKLFVEYLSYGQKTNQIALDTDIVSIANYIFTLKSGVYAVSKIRPNREELMKVVNTGLFILQ